VTSPDAYREIFSLEGKTALVAGGAGGIGCAISAGLASFGASVAIGDRDDEQASAAAASLPLNGGKAIGVGFDAVDVGSVGNMVEAVVTKLGRVDIFVNCVGTQIEAPAEEYSEADWDTIIDVNLKSAFFLSQAVAKTQIAKGGGKHIHISSVRSALGIHRGYVGYCASKGGMNLMIKQLATEWAKHGITVNGIAPTFIRTELVAPYLEDENFYNALVSRIPLGRVGEPTDVAGLALYLAVPASNFVTGQVIFIDGGVTACQ